MYWWVCGHHGADTDNKGMGFLIMDYERKIKRRYYQFIPQGATAAELWRKKINDKRPWWQKIGRKKLIKIVGITFLLIGVLMGFSIFAGLS